MTKNTNSAKLNDMNQEAGAVGEDEDLFTNKV